MGKGCIRFCVTLLRIPLSSVQHELDGLLVQLFSFFLSFFLFFFFCFWVGCSAQVTAKEQSEWTIPPCVSNWKNAKGFVIPLDKRLAADGRGLQDVHINDNFAKLTEAM